MTEEDNSVTRKPLTIRKEVIQFGLLWVILGIAAFIKSLSCFSVSRTGTDTQKVVGLVLAILSGPLYFIYPLVSDSYCKPKKGKKTRT